MIPLTTQERKVLLFLCCLFALGLALSVFKKTSGCNFCLLELYSNQKHSVIDLNKATREELIALPGIGEKIADDIIAYRVLHGSFKDLEELKNIGGIKDAKFNRIKYYLTVK